jgi:aspartate racemase
MEKDFYKKGLAKHGIETLVPDRRGIGTINQIIYNELTRGKINPESRKKYLDIIDDLIERGAEGIVLGCTEIPLLVTPEFTRVKLFDTSAIHSEKALEYALET